MDSNASGQKNLYEPLNTDNEPCILLYFSFSCISNNRRGGVCLENG